MAEAALADEWVKTGDRLSLQRRVLRLGKPPRRWRKPPWAAAASWEPPVLTLSGKPLASVIGGVPLAAAAPPHAPPAWHGPHTLHNTGIHADAWCSPEASSLSQ